jgi:integrase
MARMGAVALRFAEWSGDSSIAVFSDDTVCAFLKDMLRNGDSPATVNTKRSQLLALWRFAWRRRMLAELPRDVPRIREPWTPPVARQADELERLLEHCSTLRGDVAGIPKRDFWVSLFLSHYDTAQRPGALIQSRMADFDPTLGTILVRAGTTKNKHGKSYRLLPETVRILGRMSTPREMLWPWPHCPRHLWTCCRRIMESAGLKCSRERKDLFYSIKRSSLSYTAARDLDLARQQAGHSSAAITLKHYIDPGIAESRSAADVLPTIGSRTYARQLLLF